MTHGWENMILCIRSVQPGVLRDLKSVLMAQAREARDPQDFLYNPVHFIPLVSTPWDDDTLQAIVNLWTQDELNFQIPLHMSTPESQWKGWCTRALAQLTFEDLQKVSPMLKNKGTRRVTESEYLASPLHSMI